MCVSPFFLPLIAPGVLNGATPTQHTSLHHIRLLNGVYDLHAQEDNKTSILQSAIKSLFMHATNKKTPIPFLLRADLRVKAERERPSMTKLQGNNISSFLSSS